MKKFTKLFLSCMAVSAITAAIATSAMAASITGEVTGEYNEETGVMTLETEKLNADKDTQMTVLVLGPDGDVAKVEEKDIVYINQGVEVDLAETNMGLLGSPTEETAPGTYKVRVGYYVGGEFKVAAGSFTLGGTEITLGEVDGDADQIDTNDATCVLKYANSAQSGIGNAGKTITKTDGTTILVGEVDGDADQVDTNDATCILKYANSAQSGTGNVGTTVVGTME